MANKKFFPISFNKIYVFYSCLTKLNKFSNHFNKLISFIITINKINKFSIHVH